MLKKHYFLFAALVVYQRDKLERTKPLNILITSDEQIVTRPQLGRAQQQAQVRFVTEFDPEQKATITDVFMQSVSYLGYMDEKTFHGEFYVEPEDRTAPAPAAANDAEAGMPSDTQFAEGDQDAPQVGVSEGAMGYATDEMVEAARAKQEDGE